MRYKSCIWIESGISFDIDSYKVCCLYSSKGGGNTIVESNYNGHKIDWNKFFEFKNQMKMSHKKGIITPNCIGCVNLIEKDWDENSSKIKYINLDYWTKCNSRCSYCFTMQNKDMYNNLKNYNFLPILDDILKNNIISPDGHVSFGGGEVTLLEEFEDVLNTFIDLGFKHIKIHTSGIIYSLAIERGLECGCVELIVSVDAGSKELHKKIKQVDSYDIVWENLSKYSMHQKGNSVVKTKYIVVPEVNDLKSEIDLWLTKSNEVGIKSVLQEIESEWFYKRRENVPVSILELFNYAKGIAQGFGLEYQLYERAEHMFLFYNEKHSNIFKWYLTKIANYLFNIPARICSKIFSFLSRLC